MKKYFRCVIFVLICATQFLSFSGCDLKDSKEVIPLVDVQTPDIRRPELSASEVSQFMEQYGMSSDLMATGKTLEILSGLDEWPDKMHELVLLLPAELITDEIYRKLAEIFLHDLNYDEMARFLELCFDTYEYAKDSSSVLLIGNASKLEGIRYSMEQLAKEDEYKDRGMLRRYGLFASVKYIPAFLNQNPTSLQAFSIVEHADIEHYYYEPVDKNYTFVVDSLILNYIGISQAGQAEVPQNVQIYETAMDASQLMNLYNQTTSDFYRRIIETRNLQLSEETTSKFEYESWILMLCGDFDYAYTRITFSDKSIGPVRMVFPKGPKANVFRYGEEINEQEGEGVIICAESLWN